MGQSNAVGENTIDTTYPVNSTIKAMCHTNNSIVDAVDPLPVPAPFGSEGVGFAITAARAYAANRLAAGRTVLIINCARGSTSFTDNTWIPAGVGTQWCLNRTRLAFSLPGSHALAGVWWHQGENDAAASMEASVYASNLIALINYVRDTFPSAGPLTPWVTGQLATPWIGTDPIRNSISRVSASVSYLVRAALCIANENITAMMPDGIHFTAASQRSMGLLYAAATDVAPTLVATSTVWSGLGSLYSRYTFDIDFNDTSGFGRHASSTGSSLASSIVTDGTRSGKVFLQPASGTNYLKFPGPPASFTVTFWHQFGQFNVGTHNIMIAALTGSPGANEFVFWLENVAGLRLAMTVNFAAVGGAYPTTTNINYPNSGTLTTSTWYFHAVSLSAVGGTQTFSNYINGYRWKTATLDATIGSTNVAWSGAAGSFLQLANYNGATQPDDVNGRYDELTLWNRTLTPAEVMAIYLQTKQTLNINTTSASTSAPTANPTPSPTSLPTAAPTVSVSLHKSPSPPLPHPRCTPCCSSSRSCSRRRRPRPRPPPRPPPARRRRPPRTPPRRPRPRPPSPRCRCTMGT